MPCFHPLKCVKIPCLKNPSGFRMAFDSESLADESYEHLEVPCGKCVGCKLEHSRKWAMRCVYEAQMHRRSCFITLTYDPKYEPPDGNLCKRDLTLFLKRLRKKIGEFRYFACGEYGEKKLRPHYHAIIFGFDFYDKRRTVWLDPDGNYKGTGYESQMLNELWQKGFCGVGDCTFESCAYVARYTLKKSKENFANTQLRYLEHGIEVPDYIVMSRRPGIAAPWFEKYGLSDVYPHDVCFARGHKCKPPRYFDKLLERIDKEMLDEIKSKRRDYAITSLDNLPERLKVRELVQLEKLKKNCRRLLD